MTGVDDAAAREAVKERALDLLARREHAVKELAEKLVRRTDADEETVRAVVEELATKGMVSDERFAEAYARDAVRLKPRASRRIVDELVEKGVPARVAAPAVEAAFADEEVDDRALAFRLGQGYRDRLEGKPAAARWRRLAGYLQRRGFPNDLIYEVCDDLLPGVEDR